MNAQDLKNSILQLAVQGKLVEQRPEEGTAKELLEQIKAEKEKLIKEKKIKKEKPLPEITEDEIPFEIPESWEWVRLRNVCVKLVDGDHNPPKGIDNPTDFIMASSTNINNDTLVELEKVRYLTEEVYVKEHERTNATVGDIFFTSVGTLGRSCVYNGGFNICFQRSVSVITTLLFNYYLKYAFDSAYFQYKVMREATGTAQKGFYLNQLASAIIPVPPLAEQKRIVAKIEEILPYIDQYDKAYTKLETFNKKFPEDMKKSILQLAMQGKLVEQRPEEGTADELYEQIVAEKAQLIKDGKIKKEKSLPEITEDEIPFEIPNSWKWVRLGAISAKLTDGSHNPPPNTGIGYCVISAKNIKNGEIVFGDDERFVDEEGFIKENPRTNITHGDIIMGIIGGSIGNLAIYNHDRKVIAQRSAAIIDTMIDNRFCMNVLQSSFCQSKMKNSSGTAQGGVYLGTLKNLLIPLPPLAEQKRIVAKIEELLPYCDQLVK
ncbi:restriction modification system DNA specificity domain protein [Enterocloster bolteae CAG:59]|nr:restriction modification system DNA specificity domain protein [Enterocloster bolteae CAG:59]